MGISKYLKTWTTRTSTTSEVRTLIRFVSHPRIAGFKKLCHVYASAYHRALRKDHRKASTLDRRLAPVQQTSKQFHEHFTVTTQFLALCRERRFLLTRPNEILKNKATWCGRPISSEGIKTELRTLDGLLELGKPTNALEIQKFYCAINWIHSRILFFAPLTASLLNFLTNAK